MITITVILAAAALAFGIARGLGIPAVPLLVLAGVALNASGALPEETLLQDALLLGLTFLVFAAGTELNPHRVGAQRRVAIRVGLAQFFALAAIGLAVARALGFAWLPALYIALALTASSTLVVLNILRQRQQFFEPFGRLVLGVLLLQDVLVVFSIAALAKIGEGPAAVALALTATLGLVCLAWLCVRWVTPYLLLKLGLDEETLLLAVLSILFVFLGLAHMLNIPLIAGAFLGGVSLSAFPVSGVIRGQLNSLADFFHAVFFVALGATLALPSRQELLLACGLALLVLVLTPPLVTLIATRAGLSSRSGIEGGLLLAQCSEFSIVAALLGAEQGHIDSQMLSVIALVTVITMIVTPFVATDNMTWRLMRWAPFRKRVSLAHRPSQHVLILGCGPNLLPVVDALLQRRQPVVVVDDDAAIVEHFRQKGVDALRGDGADYHLLRTAGARNAKVVVSTMRRLRDNERLLRFTKGSKVIVRVFAPAEADRIRALGGIAVPYAVVAADGFLQWFDQEFAPSAAAQRPVSA